MKDQNGTHKESLNETPSPESGKDQVNTPEQNSETILRRFEDRSDDEADQGKISFEELFNISEIQFLQDDFATATCVASIITRPDGTPITKPSRFCRLCNDIIRKTEEGLKNCFKSDAIIGQHNPEGPIIRTCLSGGLWDAGASITVKGRHIANWLIGQVRNETQTEENMRAYAKTIGVDEHDFLEAFYEVPTMSQEQFKHVSQLLFTLANQISSAAYQNVRQSRFIIQQKRIEEALKESENRYRLLAENSADVIFLFDTDMVITYASPSIQRLTGFSPDEIIGKPINYMVTEDSFEAIMALFWNEMQNENSGSADPRRTRTVDVEMIARNGSTVWTEVRSTFVRDGQSKIREIMGIARDITERRKAEEELRKSEEKFKKIFFTSPDAISISSLIDGRYISVNNGFGTFLGYSSEELRGKTEQEFNLWNDGKQRAEFLRRLQDNGKVDNLEAQFKAKSGEVKYGMISGAIIDLDSVPHVLSIARDITEHVETEEEKARMQSHLFQAQKMEAIGTFTGGIAHDFNNILTALLGYAALLRMKIVQEDLRSNLDQILSAAHKATDLIQNLLAFSRQQAIVLKPVSINTVVKKTSKLLRRLLTEDISLKVIVGNEDVIVMADATQIDQILFNLTTNARDAMPHGGSLVIETRKIVLDENFRHFHGYGDPGTYLLITISDTGCGMDQTTQKKIFDPFFTTKELGKGTGLGLSTAYGVVKQHNGYISVYSEPGVGTLFNIYLPEAPVHLGEEAEKTEPASGGHETILVAEDSLEVRSLLKELLAQYGYRVVEAIDGKDAIEQFNKTPKVDLLILDSVMPGLNGREVYNKLTADNPNIKVLFVSGYTKDVVLDKGIESEKFAFVPKPIIPDVFLRKVREILGNE